MPNKKMPKNAELFYCEKCDFKCSKQSNWNTHILTRKHKILTNPNKILINPNKILTNPNNINITENNNYVCYCGKVYKHGSTLSAHKKNAKKCQKMPKMPIIMRIIM